MNISVELVFSDFLCNVLKFSLVLLMQSCCLVLLSACIITDSNEPKDTSFWLVASQAIMNQRNQVLSCSIADNEDEQ